MMVRRNEDTITLQINSITCKNTIHDLEPFFNIFNHILKWTTKLTMLSHPSYGFSTMGFTNGLITSMIAMNTEGFTEKIRNV